jgi:hypothetical protein
VKTLFERMSEAQSMTPPIIPEQAMLVADRFWSKVDKRGPDECWPWRAYKNTKGYGRIVIARREYPAARIAWQLANQAPWPEGRFACHTCDNRECANPAHIWPGTPAENTHDMLAKGRHGNQRPTCRRGHPFAEYRRPSEKSRRCRICQRQAEISSRQKAKLGAGA